MTKSLKILATLSLTNSIFISSYILISPTPPPPPPPTQNPTPGSRPTPTPTPPYQPSASLPPVLPTQTRSLSPITSPPSAIPTLPPPTTQPPPDNRCIVKVSGTSYDLTAFKTTHPGGDIFNCDTDMTETFFSQHNQEILQKMAKYAI